MNRQNSNFAISQYAGEEEEESALTKTKSKETSARNRKLSVIPDSLNENEEEYLFRDNRGAVLEEEKPRDKTVDTERSGRSSSPTNSTGLMRL